MLSFLRPHEKSETYHGKKQLCRTQFSVRKRTHDAVLHETREEESFSLQVFFSKENQFEDIRRE